MHSDQLEGDYSFTHPYILKSLFHEHVIHRSLARRISPLIMDIWDEVTHSLDETWGVSTTEWRDIPVVGNMMTVIARVSNRMFVGLPLCRNPVYLKANSSFSKDVIVGMTLLSFVPQFLKPIFGPLFTLPNRYHWSQTAKFTKPLIEQRKADMERAARDPTFKWEEPNDYISWHLRLAQAENKTLEQDTDMVSRFLMPIEFAAIHTTVFTITMMLFDLISSDPALGYLEGIKEEVERVYAEENGIWSKASLARLHRTDSAIRESMRVSTFMTRGVLRKVVSPHGVPNEEEGWTAKQNARIGVDVWSVHHDPDIYPNPNFYDAFRYSRPREEFEKTGNELEDQAELLKLKGTGMITTGPTFLPFGHGRHAWYVECRKRLETYELIIHHSPGRFFASHEIKMLLAYMVMNYDVQHLAVRPANKWL